MEHKKVKEHYKFFQNKECEYFPCHKTQDKESFNCLFCYCPLYALKEKCGGNFRYTEKGIKDCSQCMMPHGVKGYEHVMEHINEIIKMGTTMKGTESS